MIHQQVSLSISLSTCVRAQNLRSRCFILNTLQLDIVVGKQALGEVDIQMGSLA